MEKNLCIVTCDIRLSAGEQGMVKVGAKSRAGPRDGFGDVTVKRQIVACTSSSTTTANYTS